METLDYTDVMCHQYHQPDNYNLCKTDFKHVSPNWPR